MEHEIVSERIDVMVDDDPESSVMSEALRSAWCDGTRHPGQNTGVSALKIVV